MKTLYSILIFLTLSFSAMGENNFSNDTVRTSIAVTMPSFTDLLGRAIEENDVYVLSPVILDSINVVMTYKDPKCDSSVTVVQKVPKEYFLDSFQYLLLSYVRGQADLEKGSKDGFNIYILRLSRIDLDTSTLIFLVKNGKVLEIYFY